MPVIGSTGPYVRDQLGHALLVVGLACWLGLAGACQALAQTAEQERQFPKTLNFDEPGIDDEISLPTFVLAPGRAGEGHEMDLDFELDKRVTTDVSVQINVGYTRLPLAGTTAGGWQNVQVTLKDVVLSDPAKELLGSVSLTREFGASGAARIGAPSIGSTVLAGNIGQGFSPFVAAPLIKPFAVTGVFGYAVPDRSGVSSFQQAMTAFSLQYSFDVLAAQPGFGLSGLLRPFIPIVECVYTQPTDGRGRTDGTLAPGLVYAGNGFQLAAEALVPWRKASGTHVGFIAQLNVSLENFSVPAFSRPIWP